MFERLELNYFKKHEHLTVDFTEGLNGIVGPNYTGKSTVIYGLLYCLGGARMVPGTRLQTRGTNSGFRQTAWFNVAGKGRYKVERTKTGAALFELVGDKEIPAANGTKPVNQAVAKLLGMPLKRFAQIKYAKQGQAAAILRYGSTELFQIITELTGLGRVTEVLDLATADLKAWNTQLGTMQRVELAPLQAEMQLHLDKEVVLAREVEELLSTEGALQLKLDALAAEDSRLRTAQTFLSTAQTTVRHATRELESVQAAVAEAETKLSQFTGTPLGVDALNQKGQELAEQRAALQQARTRQTEFARLTRELAAEAERLAIAKAVAVPLRKVFDQAKAKWDSVDPAKALAALGTAQGELMKAQAALSHEVEAGKSGVCTACKRPFEEFDPAAHAKHIDTLKAAVATAQAKRDEQQEVSDQISAAQAAFQRAEKDRDRAVITETAATEAHARLSGELEALGDDITPPAEIRAKEDALTTREEEIATGRHDAQRQATLLAAVETEKGRVKQRQDTLVAANSALAAVIAEHKLEGLDLAAELERVQGKQTALRSEIRKQADEVATKQAERQTHREQRLVAERGIQSAQEQNEKYALAEAKVSLLGELQGHLRGNRDRYSKQVWDVFMASASLFASNSTGGVIESITRGEDGAFTFVEDGFEMDQSEGSGAQMAIIGTAVQMALAEAAQSPLNVILMDEPTADMDPERALAFSTLLAASGKQVIMVTHREMDSAVFDNCIGL